MQMSINDFLTFLSQNKEWIFSGIGVAIIGWILQWIIRKTSRRKKNEQNISAGDGSTNIQVRNNAQITIGKFTKGNNDLNKDIQPATLEDMKEYEPRTRKLLRAIEKLKLEGRSYFFCWALVALVIILLIGKLNPSIIGKLIRILKGYHIIP